MQPLWFHVCNMFLHATASLLFTRVCLAVAGLQPNFAGAAGVLFAVHPIHTEARSCLHYGFRDFSSHHVTLWTGPYP
ncbi:hypothetical protein L9F63_011650, partial [Diploptera punctata]